MRSTLRAIPGLLFSVIGTTMACVGVSGASFVTACPEGVTSANGCPSGGALHLWLLVAGAMLTLVGLVASLREAPRLAPYLFALPFGGYAVTAVLLVWATDNPLVAEQQTPVIAVATIFAAMGIAGGAAIRAVCDHNVREMLAARGEQPAAARG